MSNESVKLIFYILIRQKLNSDRNMIERVICEVNYKTNFRIFVYYNRKKRKKIIINIIPFLSLKIITKHHSRVYTKRKEFFLWY